jgi:hypothetical protein
MHVSVSTSSKSGRSINQPDPCERMHSCVHFSLQEIHHIEQQKS